MDYGPSLIDTYEVGSRRPNIAYKGIAVRLDAGAGGVSRGRAWTVFDHDTLRWAAGWTDAKAAASSTGTASTSTASTRCIRGSSAKCSFQNPTGPGWADPADGSASMTRALSAATAGAYGPLPARRGHGTAASIITATGSLSRTPSSDGRFSKLPQRAELPDADRRGQSCSRDKLDVGSSAIKRVDTVDRIAPERACGDSSVG